MENVVEVVQQTQQPAPAAPAAPASPSDETSAKPETKVGTEGTEKQGESEETPQRRESRRQRQLNRERERRIAAETELRLLREQQGKPDRQRPEQVSDEPKREQFDSYEEFIRADAKYHAEKAADERARKVLEDSKKSDERERTKGEQERVTREWNARLEKARDVVEDFDEVCAESEAPVTQPMSAAILESDHGPLIAYHLAKNPAEAERISKLTPSKQAAAIVALEEKVAKPAKQPSNAPAPINPVGQKGAEVQKDPAQMSDAEYTAWRKRRRAAKGV